MSLILSDRGSLLESCIFNSTHQTLLITVNTEGAMGRGIALACRNKHPRVYKLYHEACKRKILTANSLFVCRINDEQQVLLFPTKINWRGKSPVQLILDNLDKLAGIYPELGITSLATPLMGMENGWLRPHEKVLVFDKMKATFESMDIECEIFMHCDV